MSGETGSRHPYHVDAIGVPVLIVLVIAMGVIALAFYRDSKKRHLQFLKDRLDSQLDRLDGSDSTDWASAAGSPRAVASGSGGAPAGKLFKFA